MELKITIIVIVLNSRKLSFIPDAPLRSGSRTGWVTLLHTCPLSSLLQSSFISLETELLVGIPLFVSLAKKHWNDNEKQVVRAFNSWIRLHALFKNGFTFAIQCNGNSTIWNRAHVRSYLKKSETSYQRHRKQWTVNISVSFHQNSWNFVSKISYFSDFVMRNKTQRVN